MVLCKDKHHLCDQWYLLSVSLQCIYPSVVKCSQGFRFEEGNPICKCLICPVKNANFGRGSGMRSQVEPRGRHVKCAGVSHVN